jgi:SAM-dependent methyltransferase
MLRDAGEQYYYEQYVAVLEPMLERPRRVLDVGCQYGRFLVPLTEQGHDVTGTDIDADCLARLHDRLPGAKLRQESAETTAAAAPAQPFDLILCLELLYLIPDWQDIIAGLGRQLAPGGRLLASHRPIGYYIHRLLHERRYDELEQLLAGRHPALNAQTPEALRAAYSEAGLTVTNIAPIGAFSGIHVDPFAALTDAGRLTAAQRAALMRLETDPDLSARFADSARYLLVVAVPR